MTLNDKLNAGGSVSTDERSWNDKPLVIAGESVIEKMSIYDPHSVKHLHLIV